MESETRWFDFYHPGKAVMVTTPASEGYTVAYSYNALPAVTETYSLEAGRSRAFVRNVTYDYADDDPEAVSTLLGAGGTPVMEFAYDSSGNRELRQDPANSQSLKNFYYDNDERLRRVRQWDGVNEYLHYDHNEHRFLRLPGDYESIELSFAGIELRFVVSVNPNTNTAIVTEDWSGRRFYVSSGAAPVAELKGKGSSAEQLRYNFHGRRGEKMLSLRSTDGATLARFHYGAFGEVCWADGIDSRAHVVDTPRRFNDKEYDPFSELTYYGYRYLDPYALQWNRADPLFRFAPDIAFDQPRHMNLYAYTLNNAVGFVDPDGLRPIGDSFNAGLAQLDASRAGASPQEAQRTADVYRIVAGAPIAIALAVVTPDQEDVAVSAMAAPIDGPAPFAESGAMAGSLIKNAPKKAAKALDEIGDALRKLDNVADAARGTAPTSRAARRDAMRANNTPTSRPATSQSGPSGRRQTVVEGSDGKPRVQTQHPPDSQHPNPHWHDGKPKVDRKGKPRKNQHGQIKDQNEGRSTVEYPQ